MMNSVINELFGPSPPGWRVVYLCYGCKHFRPKTFTCPAFPKGIPSSIMEGFMPHTTVFRDQVGNYVFEPKSDFKPTELFGSVGDLTRRVFRPKEDIIKWITYKGRRIPIFKKRPPTKTYRALSQLLTVVSGVTLGASFRAVKRLSKFLEEKGARWLTADDPIWKRHVKRLEDYFPFGDVGTYKIDGKMYLPQIVRIDRTLREIEKRFPGILSGVHMTCIPQGSSPSIRAFVNIDRAHLEGGTIFKNPKFSDLYFNKIFKHAGVVKEHATYRQLRSVYWIPEMNPYELEELYRYTEHFKRYSGSIEPTLVTFVSSGYADINRPSVSTIAHEFGHVFHDKHDKLREFMLNVYAPYLGRCAKGGLGKFPNQPRIGRAKLPYLVDLYQKDAKFRSVVYTPYSLVNPFEGYAEAFKGYIVHPQILKRKWPEAYDFFRKMERGLS